MNKEEIEQKVMNKEEIEHWINRWKMLQQSPIRDMVIKIWSNLLKKYEFNKLRKNRITGSRFL